jgi:hypothetical protein
MNITKITIGRLYNSGNYEHVRFELTAEIPPGESPATCIIGMEKILAALSPNTSTRSRDELKREQNQIDDMRRRLGEGQDNFRSYYGSGFVGTPEEYIARCEESHAKNVEQRDAWEARSAKARRLLDDLGGAVNFKDAKLEWEDDDYFD